MKFLDVLFEHFGVLEHQSLGARVAANFQGVPRQGYCPGRREVPQACENFKKRVVHAIQVYVLGNLFRKKRRWDLKRAIPLSQLANIDVVKTKKPQAPEPQTVTPAVPNTGDQNLIGIGKKAKGKNKYCSKEKGLIAGCWQGLQRRRLLCRFKGTSRMLTSGGLWRMGITP